MMRYTLPLVVLWACSGGGPDDPSSTDTDTDEVSGPHCEDTPTVVALDEVTPLGFAASELAAWAEGTHAETFVYAEGGSTPLTLAVTVGPEARYVTSVAVYPDDGTQPAIGVECFDRVEVDLSVSLETDDGAFDEGFDTTLQSMDGLSAEWFATLDPGALGGSYDLDDPEVDWSERKLFVQASFDAEGSSGSIAGQLSGQDDCEGPDCAAWAMNVEVGHWGQGEE